MLRRGNGSPKYHSGSDALREHLAQRPCHRWSRSEQCAAQRSRRTVPGTRQRRGYPHRELQVPARPTIFWVTETLVAFTGKVE